MNKPQPIVLVCCIAATLISVIALVFSLAAINGEQLEFDYNNTIGFAGILFAVAGVVITIYFITFGHKTYEIYKQMSDAEEIADEVRSDMYNNHVETINLISSIKGVTHSKDKLKYLSLAEGRLLCSSRFSNDEEKETGIIYLQQFSNKESDIELLKEVAKEARKNKKIKEAAKNAIKVINRRIK